MTDRPMQDDRITALAAEGRTEEAWHGLWVRARDVESYSEMRWLLRLRRHLSESSEPPPLPARAKVSLLSGATVDMLPSPLELVLESTGISATVRTTAYGTYAHEMLDAASDAAAFAPDVAVLVTSTANVPRWPEWNAADAEVDVCVEEVAGYWLGLARRFHENAGCDVVLGNFHPLPTRPFGSAGLGFPGEPNRFLHAVNDRLVADAPSYVHVQDVAGLAARYGVDRWFDERFWYHAKQPVSFECLVPYVRNVAEMIAARLGRAAKCVVLDLDNTLWGGVVGDDGPEHLALGQDGGVGEAFVAFQEYLTRLKARGLLLAVCSKNEHDTALTPFESRPEMVLEPSDFVAFVANWDPKSENLRRIAASLDIGLDALVFVDDNPAERAEVRRALPEVHVVELTDDPADYPRLLDRCGRLGVLSVSREDLERSDMYRANAARQRLETEVTDYDAYLRSLGQEAVVGPFEAAHLDRITQLTNKTNQFNLTTLRKSRAELEGMMRAEEWVTACVRLSDRFGDNGLISVLAARGEGEDLHVELWLMSCRVLKRDVEKLLCNHLVEEARARGYRRVRGRYVPTDRNALVADHYADLGFEADGSGDEGETKWTLEVDGYEPFDVPMRVTARAAGVVA